MAKGKTLHVVPNQGDWAVKKGGSNRATKIVTTQKEAIEIAKEIAKDEGAELFVHRKDGQIRERSSYGNDPFPPKN